MLTRLAALLFLAAAALPGMAADLPTHPFIHVSASASLGVTPDTGEIDFEIVSADQDATTAWNLVRERLDASRALFAAHGVAAEDITVQDILRRPRKTEHPADGTPPQMDTRVAVNVVVRDLSAWAAMIQSLMTMANVESLAVAFSRSDRDKIEAELVRQALANARDKAQNIARNVGTKLEPATGVTLGAFKNLSNAMGMATDPSGRYTGGAPDAPRGLTLVAAQTLWQGVDVIYRIGR
ncbi:SIMPL domain-containing protein [Massilia consociata]|uniref:SIMPL domain-containing protein n=1 Tax=Massilia consociata TaxID=760117 RepID=A0ABV6FIC9_9BURK